MRITLEDADDCVITAPQGNRPSMLIYRRTSLLESPAQTLVNTVNCVGVMGKGLAKAFKDREPAMFARYRDICAHRQLSPGTLWLWRGTAGWVLNFPTKVHWKQPSRLEWIEAGLEKFISTYEDQGIREVSFPRLGCGNGNLEWRDVQPLMEHYLRRVDIPVFIHDFEKDIGLPEHLERCSQGEDYSRSDVSFDSFVGFLRTAVRQNANGFATIEDGELFFAYMDDFNCLSLEAKSSSWTYDMEDLHGAWVSLLRGLATREKVEWSKCGGGSYMITLMSLLPTTRPIEIQCGTRREIAVELKPEIRQVMGAGTTGRQLALEWH